ncbi:MAG: hypothetical protein DRO09_01620 [Thermoprotei archaeon]|nr:MAG: hypothetical protein DRO09_01620 [Thermoprotei archaeon]
MYEVRDVGVVGAGLAGLYASKTLLREGYSVDIFEEHRAVGIPKHCTGLISSYTLYLLGKPAIKSVVNAFDRYELLFINHKGDKPYRVTLQFRERVYLVDRVNLEKKLYEEVVAQGGRFFLKTHINRVIALHGKYRVSSNGRAYGPYDVVVIAEGAKRVLVRKHSLCPNVTNAIGFQAMVKLREGLADVPYIFISSNISRYFFGWLVPYAGREYLVGVMDSNSRATEVFTKLLSLLRKLLSHNITRIREFFGGYIPLNKLCIGGSNRVIGVGDAISPVKPFTGGGIYGVVESVNSLSDALKLLREYGESTELAYIYGRILSQRLKRLASHHAVKGIVDLVGGFSTLGVIARLLRIKGYCVKYYDDMLRLGKPLLTS